MRKLLNFKQKIESKNQNPLDLDVLPEYISFNKEIF